ncbi:MAG: RNA degradosome polyphosphate kinase [Kurthia sp.]|nr:RNA degradosome polyphosphate kinase [Candidatus Kurthia equi]
MTDEQLREITKPEYYNNRELSWLAFNERVLQEGEDERNPLLERLRFIAIFSSNLDEFYMVRVAGLQDQVRAGFYKPENKAGLTPKEQLAAIEEKTFELVKRQMKLYRKLTKECLPKENVYIHELEDLNEEQLKYVGDYFEEIIFPVLTPIAVDAYRPFPTLLSKSHNLLVMLTDKSAEKEFRKKVAIVQVPSVLQRYVQLPRRGEKIEGVLIEDIITSKVHELFKGFRVDSVQSFRLTRNADLTIHEEGARDLLTEIEKELKKRKWGSVSRVEIRKGEMNQHVLKFLMGEIDDWDAQLFNSNGPLDLTFLFGFAKVVGDMREDLQFENFIPQVPQDLTSDENIFVKALKQDVLLHHPYESFTPVIDFVTEAAKDPSVLAIKQTLYRVSGNSPVIKALKLAAENGKQVTVLVELKARFDEENNVHWAKELEQAGCLVIYGMHNLKTHSKITLVVRKRNGRIERFIHLGTGNYNDATAKIYTDFGIITTKKKLGIDATNFFNYLSGYTEKPKYHHLVVSPYDIRDEIIRLIDVEIEYHKLHGNGAIKAKMNALTDKELIMKFFEASMAGVKVDLIIRGICCLRPGVKGVSENITVTSIVGRFLEHTRIYWFHHNGENKVYLSSADLMTRNMVRRVEILFPIFETAIKNRIMDIFNLQLSDNSRARVLDSDGSYHYKTVEKDAEIIDSQAILAAEAHLIVEVEE